MLKEQFDFRREHQKLRDAVSSEKMLIPEVSARELEQLCSGDEHLLELLQSTLEQCARYTEDVARFLQVKNEGQAAKESGAYYEIDQKRRLTHEATIDSINVLARELSRYGRDGSWIKKLAGNRAAYMRFALRVTFDRMQLQK